MITIHLRLGLATLFAAGLAALGSAGTWNEVGDAGQLVPTTQDTIGIGSLNFVNGTLGSANDVDLYCINVTDFAHFSADVSCFKNGIEQDTYVFLFDSTGMGIAFNDDKNNSGGPYHPNSLLPAGASQYANLAPGHYILGISFCDNNAISVGGKIFGANTFGGEGVWGPTGPGGGSSLSGWTNNGGVGAGPVDPPANYTISLTGTAFCTPEPFTMSLGIAGVGLFVRRRVRAKKI